MKKMIYFTGQVDSPFLTNEISKFVNEFDEVMVIAYDGDKTICDKIAEEYKFKYHFVKDIRIGLGFLSKLRSIKKNNFVKDEFKKVKLSKSRVFKKKLYLYYYCIYLLKVDKYLRNYMNDDNCEYYLYSFWLSRPAFAVSYISNKYKNVVRGVSRTHRYDLYEEENDLNYLPFRKYICENIDTIYFSSIDTVTYFDNKNYSIKKPSYKLSYLGTKDYGRKKEKSTDSIVIASCSYIIKRKRLDLIISLVSEISKLHSVKWIHIGNGEDEQKMIELANEKLENVDYQFLGKMSDEEIYDNYKKYNVDFFVNLSDSEGIPVSILEAMSMGIPVIARNVGGISDAIDDECGILIKNDANSLDVLKDVAKKIVCIFDDNNEYQKYSNAIYDKWFVKFNSDKNIEKVAKDIISNDVINQL
ncbi:MAG: glycosyltransferase [Acholeplasmatales bacterium]|nr:glycosyltransferase [Acholeplasmatales bacterium]